MDGEVDCEVLGGEVLGEKISIPQYHPKTGWCSRVGKKNLYSDTEVHALILAKCEHSRLKLPLPEEELTAFRYSQAQLEFV
jgi:hypothetical protein